MQYCDFALPWLNFLGNSVYNNGNQILRYNGHKCPYEISPLSTKVKLGEELAQEDNENEFVNISYPDLLAMGYVMVNESDERYFWKAGQRGYYRLVKKAKTLHGLTYDGFRPMKSKHNLRIQHDPASRRIRLLGTHVLADESLRVDSGCGPWIYYDKDKPIMHKVSFGSMSKNQARSVLRHRLHGETIQPESEYQEINEVPLILSDDRYVVCMKKQDTCQRIIVVGESRQGKSLFVNATAGRIFYKWQERMGWLIDPMNQFHSLSAPQDFKDFVRIIGVIGEEPKPLPAVQLYMACKNRLQIQNENISLLLTLSLQEFMNKIKLYSHGIDDWAIKGSTRYLYQYISKIKGVQTGKEFTALMAKLIPKYHEEKNIQSMVGKWAATFDTIFKEKFTTNMYDNPHNLAVRGRETMPIEVTNELKIKFKDGKEMSGHPFIMLMEAGTIPVINIAMARNQRWIRNYIADLLNKIVQHQMELGENRKRIWLIADELNEIYEKGKYKDLAAQNFEQLYRQGAFNNLGFIGNTQSLTKLNPEMYNNATHICCVYMKDSKDRKRLRETFGLTNELDEMMRNLKKQEVMIFSKEPMITYDRWGRRKEIFKDYWKGRIIPPINNHAMPKAS